jgi:hypothetical protein
MVTVLLYDHMTSWSAFRKTRKEGKKEEEERGGWGRREKEGKRTDRDRMRG